MKIAMILVTMLVGAISWAQSGADEAFSRRKWLPGTRATPMLIHSTSLRMEHLRICWAVLSRAGSVPRGT